MVPVDVPRDAVLVDPVVLVPAVLVDLARQDAVLVDPELLVVIAEDQDRLLVPIVPRPRAMAIAVEAVQLDLEWAALPVPAFLPVPDSPVRPNRFNQARRLVRMARPRAREPQAASARPKSRSKTRSSTRRSKTSTR